MSGYYLIVLPDVANPLLYKVTIIAINITFLTGIIFYSPQSMVFPAKKLLCWFTITFFQFELFREFI